MHQVISFVLVCVLVVACGYSSSRNDDFRSKSANSWFRSASSNSNSSTLQVYTSQKARFNNISNNFSNKSHAQYKTLPALETLFNSEKFNELWNQTSYHPVDYQVSVLDAKSHSKNVTTVFNDRGQGRGEFDVAITAFGNGNSVRDKILRSELYMIAFASSYKAISLRTIVSNS